MDFHIINNLHMHNIALRMLCCPNVIHDHCFVIHTLWCTYIICTVVVDMGKTHKMRDKAWGTPSDCD